MNNTFTVKVAQSKIQNQINLTVCECHPKCSRQLGYVWRLKSLTLLLLLLLLFCSYFIHTVHTWPNHPNVNRILFVTDQLLANCSIFLAVFFLFCCCWLVTLGIFSSNVRVINLNNDTTHRKKNEHKIAT